MKSILHPSRKGAAAVRVINMAEKGAYRLGFGGLQKSIDPP
jgi:hypothetical protein